MCIGTAVTGAASLILDDEWARARAFRARGRGARRTRHRKECDAAVSRVLDRAYPAVAAQPANGKAREGRVACIMHERASRPLGGDAEPGDTRPTVDANGKVATGVLPRARLHTHTVLMSHEAECTARVAQF